MTNLHEQTAFQLNKTLNGNEQLADWLTYGQTVLYQKGRTKGNAVDNYRPISCLPLPWELLTGIISEHLYLFYKKGRYYPKNKRVVQEKAVELKISYYWTKQCLETQKEKCKSGNGLDRLSKVV